MRWNAKVGQARILFGVFAAVVGLTTIAGAADKTKQAAPKDEAQIDQPVDAPAAAGADDEAADPAQVKNAAKKKAAAARSNKKAEAARQKKLEKAAQARQAKRAQAEAEAASEAQQLQQLQQQMQQGMAGQGRGYGSGNMRNRSMFFLMQQFDANGNGQLDPNEMQAAKLAMAQVQAGGPNVATAQYLRMFDTNGNGQLDPNEMQAAQNAMTRGMGGGQVGAGSLTLPNGQVLPKVK